jgi:hypothetical protein
MLDDLVRVDDVEALLVIRKWFVQIVRDDVHATSFSLGGERRHELDAVRLGRADGARKLDGERAVVAPEVE